MLLSLWRMHYISFNSHFDQVVLRDWGELYKLVLYIFLDQNHASLNDLKSKLRTHKVKKCFFHDNTKDISSNEFGFPNT